MKACVLLSFFGLSAAIFAQAPANKHSVSFEVKVMRSGASSNLDQGSNASSDATRSTTSTMMSRKKSAQLALEVNLRNFAPRPDEVAVEWFFFAQDVKDSKLVLLSEGSQTVAFKPGGMEKVEAVSDRARSAESRRTEIEVRRTTQTRIDTTVDNDHEKAGLKIVGWLVRTRAEDTTLGFKASSPRFEPYVNDEARKTLPSVEDVRGGFVK